MSKDTGGPAFPQPGLINDGRIVSSADYAEGGMELRDYFAAKALEGYIASYAGANADPLGSSTIASTAQRCYKMADAMLAERKKGQS